jgi:hypothetical protein
MKRRSLLVVTSFTLLLTGVVLARAGSYRCTQAGDSIRAHHAFSGEAAIRYRQSQPTHWRACVLQP